MKYTNKSKFTKTFYGKTFKPGATIDVPGVINCKGFIVCVNQLEQIKKSVKTSPKKQESVDKTKSDETTKQEVPE